MSTHKKDFKVFKTN